MADPATAATLLKPHRDRAVVVAEIHTRPPPQQTAPVRTSHMALLSGPDAVATERALLAEICSTYGALPPQPDALYHIAKLGELELRWERHTEFSTYMLVFEGPFQTPFSEPALRLFPERWLRRLPGELVAATHVAVLAEDAPCPEHEQLLDLFEGHHILSGRIEREEVLLWTSLRPHADGFGRILIKNAGYDRPRLGRLVQRVLELETYRLMALLGLVQARRLAGVMSDIEARLVALTVSMKGIGEDADDRALLDRLSDLAAEQARHAADTAFRLSASKAYAELVSERLGRLRLVRNGRYEIISSFMERRFEPAMRTCRAVEARIEGVSVRIGRAADLLRTRVDLALQEQNQSLLSSMDRRARLQLRLQQTVEGLSVAAVSYYIVGLWSYLVELATPLIGVGGVAVATGLAVPVVVFGVWTGVRRLRASIGH